MSYEKELETALKAVKKACEICMDARRSLVSGETAAKNDRSPVTIADFASQALICLHLSDFFPDDVIVGEEDSSLLRENDVLRGKVLHLINRQIPLLSSEQLMQAIDLGAGNPDISVFSQRYWTVDPIDGTKGFLRGDQYAVALALVEKGRPVLAVLGCPEFPVSERGKGRIFYAVRGKGAFALSLKGEAEQSVSADKFPAEKACFCESVESAHADHDIHRRICEMAGFKTPPFRMDSQAKYAAVACGKASVYLRLPRKKDYREKIWDHAAGALIVEEAGGRVTDFSGRPLDFSLGRTLAGNTGIFVSNGILHETVLDAIVKTGVCA
ncbi:MAG: 3'(2'),5'-bisphosphate nucleotidase [Desulfococcaceae bacterium]